MATLIEISRHPGVLRGEGMESNCTVEVEDVIALGLPFHARHHITWVEKDLPEGDYVCPRCGYRRFPFEGWFAPPA